MKAREEQLYGLTLSPCFLASVLTRGGTHHIVRCGEERVRACVREGECEGV